MSDDLLTVIEPWGLGRLTLNRPNKKNALSVAVREEISAVLAAWEKDRTVRAVLFSGAGGVFCAGFDLKEFGQPGLMQRVYESSARYHRAVWSFPKPTIAAIAGVAMGGGFDLATLCDVRIAAAGTIFGHPEIKFGAPPLFTPLRWIVGDGRARELCLTGRRLDAEEALRSGLVTEVTDPADLERRAEAIARAILEAPDATLAITKGYLVGCRAREFEEAFVAEHDTPFLRALGKAP